MVEWGKGADIAWSHLLIRVRGAGAAADAGGGSGELRRLIAILHRARAARGVQQAPRGTGNAADPSS